MEKIEISRFKADSNLLLNDFFVLVVFSVLWFCFIFDCLLANRIGVEDFFVCWTKRGEVIEDRKLGKGQENDADSLPYTSSPLTFTLKSIVFPFPLIFQRFFLLWNWFKDVDFPLFSSLIQKDPLEFSMRCFPDIHWKMWNVSILCRSVASMEFINDMKKWENGSLKTATDFPIFHWMQEYINCFWNFCGIIVESSAINYHLICQNATFPQWNHSYF